LSAFTCKILEPYDNPFWDLNNGGKRKKKEKTNYLKFPLTPMGVLATRSAHARPPARPPIDMSGNFLIHIYAESPSNISPNLSEVLSEVSEP
jgi:hypothetical protein